MLRILMRDLCPRFGYLSGVQKIVAEFGGVDTTIQRHRSLEERRFSCCEGL